MNMKIKRMEICKNLRDLRSWINSDLKENELLNFYLVEEKDEELKITVERIKNDFYTVKLNNEILNPNFKKYFIDELFEDMRLVLQKDSIADIKNYFSYLEVK